MYNTVQKYIAYISKTNLQDTLFMLCSISFNVKRLKLKQFTNPALKSYPLPCYFMSIFDKQTFNRQTFINVYSVNGSFQTTSKNTV